MTKLTKFYLLSSAALLGGYAYLTHTGWAFNTPARRTVPPEVRSNPSGFRSFHFWHVGYAGYRGGK